MGGEGDVSAVFVQNLRLIEESKLVTEWLKASSQQKKQNTRITAKDVFGKKGSATGPESMRRGREKAQEEEAKKALEQAKRDQAKDKKAREVAAQVQAGAELLSLIETRGEAAISRFTVNDILALLVNADPQGNIPRPKNKAEGLLRVRGLRTVQQKLVSHAVAAAVAATPAAAPAPPAPSAPPAVAAQPPSAPEAVERLSLGSSNADQAGPSTAL